jgi:ABC-2 type transport system ATP-binding protein
MDAKSIVTVSNFSKSFGTREVVKDLSFDVHEGEVFAFLGANGSGKTTTIRCLLGVYEATKGDLLINGKRFAQEDTQMLGYLPEERGLYVTSTVLDTLIYFGRLKGLSYDAAKKASLDYLERVGIPDKATSGIKLLSSGQQQKIQLGLAVLHKPKLLILDEPTKGLDPVNRALLMDVLNELNANGTTIIFSTHQMDEVERIADRLVMIKDGTRKLYGHIDEVKKSFGTNIIQATIEGKMPENKDLYTYVQDGRSVEITPVKNTKSQKVLEKLLADNVSLTAFKIASPSLNEIFIKVSKEDE